MLRIGIVLLVVGAASAAAQEEAENWRHFVHQGITIAVNPDSQTGDKRAYQITVSENGLPLSRLAVNRDGVLSDAWKTDLDGDGNFEIVVATGQLGGGTEGGIDIHEWKDFRFESDKPPQRIDAEQDHYRGHDQYRVIDGTLLRSFPRFDSQNGRDVPSGEMANYQYDLEQHRWSVSAQ